MARPAGEKASGALRTIGELSRELGLPQHRLRYWETRFSQLDPLKRAGQRRYYRPADIALVRRIDSLLNREGYTILGVQRLLAAEAEQKAEPASAPKNAIPLDRLRAIRDSLRSALEADAA